MRNGMARAFGPRGRLVVGGAISVAHGSRDVCLVLYNENRTVF